MKILFLHGWHSVPGSGVKTQELLRRQYAPMETAAVHGLSAAMEALKSAVQTTDESARPAVEALLSQHSV